jgi:hypothetical protein
MSFEWQGWWGGFHWYPGALLAEQELETDAWQKTTWKETMQNFPFCLSLGKSTTILGGL